MSVEIKDVPLPARANAQSLKATFDRMGGTVAEKEAKFAEFLTESVQKFDENGKWTPAVDVSAVKLEEAGRRFYGDRWQHVVLGREKHFLEAGQPVTSATFAAITGQLIFSTIRKHFALEEFVFSNLVPTIQSRIKGTETVPEIVPMGDVSSAVLEGQEYPSVGVGQAYYTLPASAKQGMKIEVSEETLFLDLTGDVARQAAAIGKFLALKREKAVIDVLIGQVNNYSRNGTAANTYLTTGTVNNQSSVELVDWTDIESAELLLSGMLDPDNSLPRMLSNRRHLVVMPYKRMTAKRIVNATEVRSGDITTGAGHQMASSNPLNGTDIMVLSSELLYRQVLAGPEPVAANARDGWFWGEIDKAFAWKEIWPLGVFQQGQDSNAGFERDIALRYKARYHGVACVVEPRYITRNENTAW